MFRSTRESRVQTPLTISFRHPASALPSRVLNRADCLLVLFLKSITLLCYYKSGLAVTTPPEDHGNISNNINAFPCLVATSRDSGETVKSVARFFLRTQKASVGPPNSACDTVRLPLVIQCVYIDILLRTYPLAKAGARLSVTGQKRTKSKRFFTIRVSSQ